MFRGEVHYLGVDGYMIDPSNIKAVKDVIHKQPRTVGEIRQLQRLLNYYRRYIQGFAQIAYPLFQLLKETEASKKNSKGTIRSS